MMGIPACFIAAPVFLILREYWFALVMFVAGYAIQFIGHLVEGNRSGEEMLLRGILEKPKRARTSKNEDRDSAPPNLFD